MKPGGMKLFLGCVVIFALIGCGIQAGTVSGGSAGASGSGAGGAREPRGGEAFPPIVSEPPATAEEMDLRVIGRREFYAGSRGAVRLSVVNAGNGSPLGGVAVAVMIAGPDMKTRTLFSSRTDKSGTADANFTVPDDLPPGTYRLTFLASAAGRKEVLEETVTVRKGEAIYLSTDKPIYQPGQMIHMRALALAKPLLRPLAGREIVFTVEDGKANRVFRSVLSTDDFGIASARFGLAGEVNMGAYRIKATAGNTTAERTVSVERYVLPKFRVVLETDKTFYRPGETVRGKLGAEYLFGKPVAGAEVELSGSTAAAGEQVFFTFRGKTDAGGRLAFEARIPSFLVGQDLLAGRALINFHALVEDGAGHREEANRRVTAGSQALSVEVIPEGGVIAPGLPNAVFVIVAGADGSPAENAGVSLTIGSQSQTARTSRLGIATFLVETAGETEAVVRVTAADGEKAEVKRKLAAGAGDDFLVAFTDKAIYKSGETIRVKAFSTVGSGSLFIDLVREGQTVWTSSGELRDGRAEWEFDLPPDLFGNVTMTAYVLKGNMNFVRSTRLLMVQPARDLLINVSAGQPEYKPGEEATLDFTVTDGDRRPVAAALGLYIVDEAVFARAEAAPGLEKVFFLLEKEIMTPRYEIHGLEFADLVRSAGEGGGLAAGSERQSAARVLLAAAGEPASREFTLTSRKERIRSAIIDAYKRIHEALLRYLDDKGSFKGPLAALVDAGYLMRRDILDPFGKEYILRPCNCGSYQHGNILISVGPDGRQGTEDDVSVENRSIRGWLFGKGEPAADIPGGEEFLAGKALLFGAAPMAAVADRKAAAASQVPTEAVEAAGETVLAAVGRVREFFPETLFVNPLLLTDGRGRATQKFTVADSITTWRVVTSGSSRDGLLGSDSRGLRVFQDFFIDPDLPLAMTVDDEISLPVAVHNYLPEPQKVRLKLDREDWFSLQGEETQTLDIGPNEVKAAFFRIRALVPGIHKIYVEGRGTRLADAVRREVEVAPNGFAVPVSISDTLEGRTVRSIEIPAGALPGGTALWLRIYPGVFAQVVDGMDNILRMPSGCFEQTSSATYPNILVLDYMKNTGKITPEIMMKAEAFIADGYQRLLTFQVPGGGYSWFGDAPANQALTAYGLMEFHDMARVRDVDGGMMDNTRRWLLSLQKPDGSWEPDKSYLHAESWGRIQGKSHLITAWILWALAETGEKSPQIQKGLDWLAAHIGESSDAYTLALAANAFLTWNPRSAEGRQLLDRLAAAARKEGDIFYWKGEATVTHASGLSADIETTAAAVIALLKGGAHLPLANGALAFILRNKDPYGTWHSTNATVMSLRALLLSRRGAAVPEPRTVMVTLDGREAGEIEITAETSDLVSQLDLGRGLGPGTHSVGLEVRGRGAVIFQIAGRYYEPWSRKRPEPQEPIFLEVDYDRTRLSQNEAIEVKVRASLKAGDSAKMVMIDIGVPPGFEVNTPDLSALVEKEIIQRYGQTSRQVMIYLEEITRVKPLEISFGMRARYPIRASIPESRAYRYYNPDEKTVVAPRAMEVVGR